MVVAETVVMLAEGRMVEKTVEMEETAVEATAKQHHTHPTLSMQLARTRLARATHAPHTAR